MDYALIFKNNALVAKELVSRGVNPSEAYKPLEGIYRSLTDLGYQNDLLDYYFNQATKYFKGLIG